MKEYKTWEVIKMLTENPKLKFECTDKMGKNCANHIGVIDEKICWLNHNGTIFNTFTMFMNGLEWTLVQQPVTFMEAVKAYAEGKTIRCVLADGGELFYVMREGFGFFHPMVDRDRKKPITQTEILEATWYIEE